MVTAVVVAMTVTMVMIVMMLVMVLLGRDLLGEHVLPDMMPSMVTHGGVHARRRRGDGILLSV